MIILLEMTFTVSTKLSHLGNAGLDRSSDWGTVTMEPQLYMWQGTRELLLKRHDFYVSQVKAKVLAQFQT